MRVNMLERPISAAYKARRKRLRALESSRPDGRITGAQMKTFLKLFAIAAAFGLAPAARHRPGALRRPRLRPPPPGAGRRRANTAAANSAAAAPRRRARARPAPHRAYRPAADGRYGLQTQVSPIGEEASWFHDIILMPLITVISLFVLALLAG